VVESKFLGIRTGQKLAKASGAPDYRHLSQLQRSVVGFFSAPKVAAELFSDSSMKERVRASCSEAEQRLHQYRLITPKEVQSSGYRMVLVAALLVVSLGAYKLLIALAKGKTNVGLLILMGVLGALAAVLVCRAPRISRRGKAYIDKLQTRYLHLKSGLSDLTRTVDDSALIFAVALFGLGTLAGTPYQTLVPMFRHASSSSGGCGGGGCGGGGCGGGCGGCGGG